MGNPFGTSPRPPIFHELNQTGPARRIRDRVESGLPREWIALEPRTGLSESKLLNVVHPAIWGCPSDGARR